MGTGVEGWCPERVVLLGQYVTGWQCWGWQCLRVVRKCWRVSNHAGGSAGCQRGDSVSGGFGICQRFQGVSGHQGSSRGCHRGVSVVSVSHGVSGDVRVSPFKGVEMRSVTRVSASWWCQSVSGEHKGVLGGCWGCLRGLRVSPFTGVVEEVVTWVLVPGLLAEVWGVLKGFQGSGGSLLTGVAAA